MHKTNAANNVANEFSNGSPPLTPGTAIDAADLNTWQRELCNVVEGYGLTLDTGNDAQVKEALDNTFAKLATENLWTDANTFQNQVTVQTLLDVTGATTLKNTTVTGTLGVTGAATLNSAAVTNNATVGGTLGVTGAATLNSAAVTNNATVGGTLGVTGNTTLTGNLGANGGATLNNGTTANASVGSSGSSPTTALTLGNGHLLLSATAPNSNAAITNLLTPTTLNKANAMIQIASGVASVSAGANIASVAATAYGSNDALRVTWAHAFASVSYVVVPAAWGNSTPRQVAAVVNKAATYVDVILYRPDTGAQIDVNDAATSAVIELVAYGIQ